MSLEKMICGENYTTELIKNNINELIEISGQGADSQVKSLEPVNHYSMKTLADFGGNGYGVATDASAQILELDLDTGIQVNFGNPVPVGNLQAIYFTSNGNCYACGEGGDLFYKLYRKVAGQDDWVLVQEQTISNVYPFRTRGLCEVDINGSKSILYAEYNVNNARIDGSTNDRLRVLRSDDDGLTWYTSWEFNTDGSNNNIRHFHGVVQNPDNGLIYVMSGDNNSQSAIYAWDGVADVPFNVDPVDTVVKEGLQVAAGAQRYRTVDIIFDNGKCYWYSDTETGNFGTSRESGVFKSNYDLTGVERISAGANYLHSTSGRLGLKLPTGEIVWQVVNEASAAGRMYSPVIVSSRDKTAWKAVGAMRGTPTVTYNLTRSFFLVGDIMYLCFHGGSGKGAQNTVAFKLSDNEFRGDQLTTNRLETLHPVYWVDPENGSDTNDGWSPRTPFKTLDYALASGELPFGGRVVIPEGETILGNGVYPELTFADIEGDDTTFLTVQGAGASKSTIAFASDAVTQAMFRFRYEPIRRLELCDLKVKSYKNSVSVFESDTRNSSPEENAMRMTRCELDGSSQWGIPFKSNGAPIELYQCYLSNYTGATGHMVSSNFAGTEGLMKVYAEGSYIFDGSSFCIAYGNDLEIKAVNCQFVNPSTAVLRLESGVTVGSINFSNCGFWTCSLLGVDVIKDFSSATFSGNEFRNCYGNVSMGVEAAFSLDNDMHEAQLPLLDKREILF